MIEKLLMKCKSKFEIVDLNADDTNKPYIYIEDRCDGTQKSVTNDAENVCKYLYNFLKVDERLQDDIRIIYKDTDGQIDELLHDKGIFKGFKPGHVGIELDF